ncbi:MAG TPA: DUF2520 domain-containing protein [Desulfobacterales bacterium]|nr:DUF2520 domain-containing protein [Desulfobacterales bacterium]
MPTLGFIGVGPVGTTFGVRLPEKGYTVAADDHIATVCSGLKWRKGQIAVHCSGASTVQSLDAAREQGAYVGSIHHCQSFSGIEQAIANLPGSTFGIKAYMPLLRGTLSNIEAVGFPTCLTGPIARGDVATIGRRLAALEKFAQQMVPLYRELGLFTVPIGQDKGTLAADKAQELKTLLKGGGR